LISFFLSRSPPGPRRRSLAPSPLIPLLLFPPRPYHFPVSLPLFRSPPPSLFDDFSSILPLPPLPSPPPPPPPPSLSFSTDTLLSSLGSSSPLPPPFLFPPPLFYPLFVLDSFSFFPLLLPLSSSVSTLYPLSPLCPLDSFLFLSLLYSPFRRVCNKQRLAPV